MVFDAMGKLKASQAYDFVMVGRDEERLDLVKKVSDEIIKSFPSLDVSTAVSTEIEDSLPGMDYCINQIRVGGLEGRAYDETFPRQFGIPGEETVGPGGFTNSMRGIPLTIDICRKIEQKAPDATLLNLTNPSSIVHYAIHRYTGVKAVGTCDSPISLTGMVAGLGMIAAGAGFVSPFGAIMIGIFAGIACFFAIMVIKKVLRIDDALDVFPVHGVSGILGALFTAVFASESPKR